MGRAPYEAHALRTQNPEHLPAEFQVAVSKDIAREDMVDILETLREYGMELHATLVGDEKTPEFRRHKNMKATSTYSNITDDCAKLKAQIIGRALRADGLNKLPEHEIDALKLTYSQLLSGNLTKLKHGVAFAREHGLTDELTGDAKYWVGAEMPALLNSCVSVIRHWAQVLIWQEKKGDKRDNYDAIIGRLIAKR